MYSAELLKHFESPQHAGDLPGANARAQLDNPVCGDILELSAHIDHEKIQTIRFRAKGCVPSMACASAVCQLATGMSTEDALNLRAEDILKEVGGIPPASTHAVQLALETLKKLLTEK